MPFAPQKRTDDEMLAEIGAILARGGVPLLARKSNSLSGLSTIFRLLQYPESEATCPQTRARRQA
jgi:hypothetical protein